MEEDLAEEPKFFDAKAEGVDQASPAGEELQQGENAGPSDQLQHGEVQAAVEEIQQGESGADAKETSPSNGHKGGEFGREVKQLEGTGSSSAGVQGESIKQLEVTSPQGGEAQKVETAPQTKQLQVTAPPAGETQQGEYKKGVEQDQPGTGPTEKTEQVTTRSLRRAPTRKRVSFSTRAEQNAEPVQPSTSTSHTGGVEAPPPSILIHVPPQEERGEKVATQRAYELAYDPYHGQGLQPGTPEFPMQLVFYLMETERFRTATEAARKWFLLLKYLGGGTLLCFLIYYLILFDYHVRVHPTPPRLSVHQWSWEGCDVFPVTNDSLLRQQEDGTGNYYAYRLNCGFKLFLNMTNVNHALDFYYESIESTFLYASRPICYDRIDNMYHRSSSTLRPFFYLFTVGLPVPLNLGYALGPKLQRGMFYNVEETIMFVAEIIAHFKIKGTRFTNHLVYWKRWRCEFTMTTKSGKDSSKCWQLEGNWRPSHVGLKLYRTSAWPRTYTKVNIVMPPIPEYYDPAFNYALR